MTKNETTSEMVMRGSNDARDRVVESLVLRGDLSGLSPRERALHYVEMCESLGLNPKSQPFAYLRLNGKEILYATRGATDQLARIHRVNREIVDGPKVIDLAGTKLVYAVCKASLPDGRFETATATVPLLDVATVLMKAETKVKRRATLSILGLGLLDEMEVESIPANVQEPGGGVDLSLMGDSDEEHQGDSRAEVEQREVLDEERREAPEQSSPVLSTFLGHVAEIDLPGEAVTVWMMHRASLAPLPAEDRERAWKALCARTEEVGKMKNARVWLKKAIAEEDARRSLNVDPGALEGAGSPRAETPRQAREPAGILGAIESAGDVAAVRTELVRSLAAYPAMSDALWSAATARAKALGVDEDTLRRMVREAQGDGDDTPPSGPQGGRKRHDSGAHPSANGKGAGGAATGGGARALTLVSDAAQGLLERNGRNPWALRNAIRKHRDELDPQDVAELARVLAAITPADEHGARLTQASAERIVRGLSGLAPANAQGAAA